MNLQIESVGDVKVVRVKEEKLVFPVLSSFFSKVSELIEAGTSKLVIDLSEVSYVDSASIGCLLETYQFDRARSLGHHAVDIHETSDGGAVNIAHLGEIDNQLRCTGLD